MNVQKLGIVGLFAFSALGITIGHTTVSYASSNSSITAVALNSPAEESVRHTSPPLLAIATRHPAKNVYADDGIYSFAGIGTGTGNVSQAMKTVMPISPIESHRNFASFNF